MPEKEETSPTCIILLLCSLQPVYKFKIFTQRIAAGLGVNKKHSMQTKESNQISKLEERKRSTALSKRRQQLPVALLNWEKNKIALIYFNEYYLSIECLLDRASL